MPFASIFTFYEVLLLKFTRTKQMLRFIQVNDVRNRLLLNRLPLRNLKLQDVMLFKLRLEYNVVERGCTLFSIKVNLILSETRAYIIMSMYYMSSFVYISTNPTCIQTCDPLASFTSWLAYIYIYIYMYVCVYFTIKTDWLI